MSSNHRIAETMPTEQGCCCRRVVVGSVKNQTTLEVIMGCSQIMEGEGCNNLTVLDIKDSTRTECQTLGQWDMATKINMAIITVATLKISIRWTQTRWIIWLLELVLEHKRIITIPNLILKIKEATVATLIQSSTMKWHRLQGRIIIKGQLPSAVVSNVTPRILVPHPSNMPNLLVPPNSNSGPQETRVPTIQRM